MEQNTNLPRVLELGCGQHKSPGAYGIDALDLPGVDVVWNLDEMPWPLPDGAFGAVIAIDVLEHLGDMVAAVKECHRVLEPAGRLTVRMPFAGGMHHLTDPTHLRGATSRTFDYFVEGKLYQEKYRYTEPLFRLERFDYIRETAVGAPLSWFVAAADQVLVTAARRWNDAYENYLGAMYPMHAVLFELIKL